MANLNKIYSELKLSSKELTIVRTINGSACLYYRDEKINIIWADNYVLSDIAMGKPYAISKVARLDF